MTEETKDLQTFWERVRGHFQEYVARYATLALAILIPLSALLGSLAADLGADTKLGHALFGAASALGVAAGGVVFIRNLGVWQMLDQFGVAPGVNVTNVPAQPLLSSDVLGVAGERHPDEDMGAGQAARLPVSPDIERPAEVSPEQTGALRDPRG